MVNAPFERLREITTRLLDPARPAYSLRQEVIDIRSIFQELGSPFHDTDDDIAKGETITASGVAISPKMAAMCLDDFARTVQFIRGMHAAIRAARTKISDRPVRVLYAGCGPWATIAVPLMTTFRSDEAVFTLMDIHIESIKSVMEIVGKLELNDHVSKFEIADAASYRIEAGDRPDIILIEMMRAGLEAEPQVAVAMNLMRQMPDALMIPEAVSIDVALMCAAQAIDLENAEMTEPDRVAVGPVFVLDSTSLKSWSGNDTGQITGAAVEIPYFDSRRRRPMLLTTVRVFGEHILKDYDSGITCPKKLPISAEIVAGDVIEFSYVLGSRPGFTARKQP